MFPSNQREQSEEIILSSCDPPLPTYRLTPWLIGGRDGKEVSQQCCLNNLPRWLSSCLCAHKCGMYVLNGQIKYLRMLK